MILSDVIRDSKMCAKKGETWVEVNITQYNWLIGEFENMRNKLSLAENNLMEFLKQL